MACISQWNKILFFFFSVSLRGILLFEWNSQTDLQGKIKYIYTLTLFLVCSYTFRIGLKAKVLLVSHVRLFVTACTVAHQAPLSMEFSRQEYQSGLPCPSPEYFSHPGIKPTSLAAPALQADSLPPWENPNPILSFCNHMFWGWSSGRPEMKGKRTQRKSHMWLWCCFWVFSQDSVRYHHLKNWWLRLWKRSSS